DTEYAGYEALDLAPLCRVVDVAQDRGGDRLYRAGTETLQRAEPDQGQHVLGKAAQGRAAEEEPGTDQEDGLAAMNIREAAIDRNADRLGQQVDREHPTEQAEPAEVAKDRKSVV